jgi:DNA replication initiation complex subunit (GINS family)
VPQTHESKFIRVPIVKSVAGTDLSVISESEKNLYSEIEKTIKKEYVSNRDDW